MNGRTPFWVAEGWPCRTEWDVQAITAEAAERYRAARNAVRDAIGQRWPCELRQISAQYHADVTSANQRLGGRW